MIYENLAILRLSHGHLLGAPKFSGGHIIVTDTITAKNEIVCPMDQRSIPDDLIYSVLLSDANLLRNGDLKKYPKLVAR